MSEQPKQVVIDGVTYVPAPPVEQAPAPEPVARWEATRGLIRLTHVRFDKAGLMAAGAKILNTLDRDGVCYGPGRPMETLPNGHPEPVLIGYDGVVGIDHRTDRENDAQYDRRCWWPLPESGE